LFRYLVLPALLTAVVGCPSHTADGDDVYTKPEYYKTPDGVNYSIYPWRYTNAIRPGGELKLCFQCYNKSESAVAGPAVFRDSTLSLAFPDGSTAEPAVNPFGTYDGPADIVPGGSHGVHIIVTDLFDFDELGDYVVRWGVAGGTPEYTVKVMDGPEYYLYRLKNDACYNEWGIHLYGEDGYLGTGLAREAVALGATMVPCLVALLDDTREGFIEGSEDATIASMYAWRVRDCAAIMLVEILGQDPGALRSMDPAARDQRVDELKTWWGEHKGEYR